MKRKLLPNRVTTRIAPETLTDFKKKVKEARELIQATPIISDEELSGYEKMGDVKRGEVNDTITVLSATGSFLPPVLSMSEVLIDLSVYDDLDAYIAEVDMLGADLRRLKTIAGCEAINVSRFAEDKANSEAGLDNQDAIKAVNELNKLIRSSDKKGTKKTKKEVK